MFVSVSVRSHMKRTNAEKSEPTNSLILIIILVYILAVHRSALFPATCLLQTSNQHIDQLAEADSERNKLGYRVYVADEVKIAMLPKNTRAAMKYIPNPI